MKREIVLITRRERRLEYWSFRGMCACVCVHKRLCTRVCDSNHVDDRFSGSIVEGLLGHSKQFGFLA